MSIDNNTCVTSYTVTDATMRTYDLGFAMREECTVAITIKRSNGVSTVIDADYYDLDEDQTKVNLNNKVDIATGDTLIISRVTPDIQQVTFTEGDKLPAKTIEYALDRATMRRAELAKQIADAQQELADMQALIDEATNSGSIAPTTATSTRLGMVKIGDNLSITDDGTLSATSQELSVATSSKLGGIKLGTGMTTYNGELRVSKLYSSTSIYKYQVYVSNLYNATTTPGVWANLANLYRNSSTYPSTSNPNPSETLTPSIAAEVLSVGYGSATTITLNANSDFGYLHIVIDIDKYVTIIAGNNLTLVDAITPGKVNHCMVMWYNSKAYLYVFAVTDREE